MNSLLNDVRYGLRILLKKPAFTLVAVLSLAMGIGANTAIFSLLDVVMLKSLPVEKPERLVLFGNANDSGVNNGFPSGSTHLFTYPFFVDIRQQKEVFSEVAALLSIPWTIHGTVDGGEIEKLKAQLVSGSYFPTLGVNANLGRTLNDSDDRTVGGHPVLVVSNAFWVRRFGGDPSAIGRAIRVDEVTYTIVGVAPSEFFGTTVGEAPDVWIPLAMENKLPPAYWEGRTDKSFQSLFLIGRLKDGVSKEQASAVVNLAFTRSLQDRAGAQPSEKTLQDIQGSNVELTSVGRGLSDLREEFSLSLKVLMVVVGLVLLIACANIANLLLAHGASRHREFAIRLAVGAGRFRLVRQLLTESLLLAVMGGVVGVGIAWWGGRMLVLMASSGPDALPIDVTPNLRILAFTLGASLLSAIIFGVAPALRAARLEPNASLKTRGVTRSAFQSPLGKVLVVGQVALSLLLLVGAGLFVRTLINLQKLPTGYDTENVMLFDIDISTAGVKAEDPRLATLVSEVETKVKSVPGVKGAAFAFFIFNQGAWTCPVYTAGHDGSDGRKNMIRNNVVGSDFFGVMGLELTSGRGFTAHDTEKSQKVAVISETMAKRFFSNESPLGKRFSVDGRTQLEIVGVVKDAKYGAVTEEIRPMAYYPFPQNRQSLNNFVVRFTGSSENVVPQIREAIKQVNRSLPIDDVVPLSEHVGRSLVPQKLVARLASFFGLLALLLACVGLYGVMSYAVARRTNEIGIRMALGARGANVLWLVLREVLLLVGIGVVLGLGVSLFATKTAAALLFGLEPNDPLTIALASGLLVVVSLLAGYLPARRAARVDPMIALREE